MSWGNMFDGSGSYIGEDYGSGYGEQSSWNDMGSYGGSSGGNKRPSSYQHDGNQSFKKQRSGGMGGYDDPSPWDNAGAMGSSGGDYFGGSAASRGRGRGSYGGRSAESEGAVYSVSSELDSWDQFSVGGGRGRGTGNRGVNRGGRSYGNNDGKKFEAGGFGGRGGGKSFGGGSGMGSGGRGGSGFGGRGGAKNERAGSGFGGKGRGGERGGAGFGGDGGAARGGRGRGGYNNKGSDQKQYQYDENMTLVQKFQRYINFLKTDKVPRQNSIQSLENACMITNCGLKTNYYTEELPRIYNRQIFTGKASVGGIYLARGVGCNKKELKHEVFNKAHKILLNRSVEDINNLKDPGLGMVRASIEKYLKSLGKGTYIEGQGTPVYKPLTDIMNEITHNLDSISVLATGLKKLTAYLQGPVSLPENPISKLEQAMIASKCGLQHMYKFECIVRDDGIAFEGVFILEDTPIARATNEQKKLCKQETYLAAIDALLTKEVNDLVIPVEKENVDQEEKDEEHVENEAKVQGVSLPDGEAPPPIVKPSLREAPMIDKVQNLVAELKLTAFTDNNVTVVDNCVIKSGLTAMRIYKRLQVVSEECASCEFFIDNIHISTGLGSKKTECMLDAYNNAWEILTSSQAEDILANHRKLAPNETTDPFVLDVVVRGGGGVNMESNQGGLRKRGFDPDDPSRSLKDLVIVELSNWWKDRKRSAFCILQTSATFSGLHLQWSFTNLKPVDKKSYKNESNPMSKTQVVFYLQGNKVADHTAYGKSKVMNFASAEVLFKLYETQDVLRSCKVDASEVCVKYSTIQAEADQLRAQAGEIKAEPETDILVERKSDLFIVNAVRNRIDTFFTTPANPLQEDLYLGPGLNDLEVRQVRAYALSKNLICNIKPYSGETYMIIKPRVELKDIVKALKETQRSSYGTYQLVPKSECPNYASLEIKGKAEMPIVSKN